MSNAVETLRGLIECVSFHCEETGFSVLRVKVTGFRDLITVFGAAPSVAAGEWLEAEVSFGGG